MGKGEEEGTKGLIGREMKDDEKRKVEEAGKKDVIQ